MSYLIALYVFYHGNNLPMFGFIPGEKEEKPRNQGLHEMTESELNKVLPSDVTQSIIEEKKKMKSLEYEAILREAIEKSQAETSKLVNSSINMVTSGLSSEHNYTTFEDDSSDYDLNFFNEMNGMSSSSGNDNYMMNGWF